MTWAKQDTEALRMFGRVLGAGAVGMGGPREADIGLADVIRRSADHIEALEKQLAELEREPDTITPRDLFAQAWLRNETHWQGRCDEIAARAFEMADAMMKERAR